MSTSTSPAGLLPAFQHRRLTSPRSIRLVNLHPSSSLTDCPELTLIEVSLDNIDRQGKDTFEALSYVWGSPVGTVPISCDGKQLLITPNCDSALRHLRLAHQDRILWVDAICIDQSHSRESIEERNTQVILMGEIYQKALCTLCWLGSGNDYTVELMRHLDRIGSCPSQRGLKKLLLFDARLRQQGKIYQDSSALNDIFCHAWHSRIWTVQEASFSHDCYIVCGHSRIPWDIYHKAIRFLVYEEFIDELDPQAFNSCIEIGMRNNLRDYLLGRVPAELDPSPEDLEDERDRKVEILSSCLTQCSLLQATEPKDRIYGLHALFTNLGISLPAVDYSKTLSVVYEEATVSMIIWSRTLKILGDACHDRTSLQSWVPNFSGRRISIPTGDATRGSRVNTKSLKVLNPKPGELHVRGKIVGRLEGSKGDSNTASSLIFPTRLGQCDLGILSEPLNGHLEDVDTLRRLIGTIRFFRQLFHILQEYCANDGTADVEDMFLDLINQDSYSEPSQIFDIWLDILQYPDSEYSLAAGEVLVAKWQKADKTTSSWTTELTSCATIAATTLLTAVKYDGRLLDYTSHLSKLYSEFSANLNNKALVTVNFFNSSRQTVVPATAVDSVKVGDSVALLEGCQWPVLLREAGTGSGRWCFLGPMFVAGTMDGELWGNDEVGEMAGLCDICLI
ncbi:heterokaryon incompatibility protein-domain-containing protein [Stachybotrys elegans]|uniref:Heterokaryon incompatibility protein-domain-containing protein n=1 Tax=Stachybotrys elegans TaxID=80388 RepID=A0A8K0SEY3_9HYPO|nr:heterokaryon incompatibility protein-domain-containing protein [Stachybotrys elegans]